MVNRIVEEERDFDGFAWFDTRNIKGTRIIESRNHILTVCRYLDDFGQAHGQMVVLAENNQIVLLIIVFMGTPGKLCGYQSLLVKIAFEAVANLIENFNKPGGLAFTNHVKGTPVVDGLVFVFHFQRSFAPGNAPGKGRIERYSEGQFLAPDKGRVGNGAVRLGENGKRKKNEEDDK
jgi:hypothetical protein